LRDGVAFGLSLQVRRDTPTQLVFRETKLAERRDDVPTPRLMPLGDSALLVRFSERIDDAATSAVVSLAHAARDARIRGVVEIVPNLVSVLLRYDPGSVRFEDLAGEVRLLVLHTEAPVGAGAAHIITIRFGGSDGPDLEDAAKLLGMSSDTFIARHNARPLRVLATGFAPGFVYCGLHGEDMRLPRRSAIRDRVPPGSVLFAAGQTALTSTTIPTGWHIIGRTDFSNFNTAENPPTRLRAGDHVTFEAAP
jgi:KipI family sensor histidine kinase inhibitor